MSKPLTPERYMMSDGKLAVITGAASGIGAGLSREAARRGYRVLMADQNSDLLLETAATIQSAYTVVTDVTLPEQLDALADRADALGGTDFLFNNAGVMASGFSWEIPAKDWQRSLSVNVGGVTNGIRSFVPRMIKRGTPSRIVNTASVGGFLPGPLMAPYSASKFAIVALTEALKLELDMIKSPIAVSLLAPGPVHTAIFEAPFAGEKHRKTEKVISKLKTLSATKGMNPDMFAELVFQSIEKGDYWIIPQPERLDLRLEERNLMIRNRHNPTI